MVDDDLGNNKQNDYIDELAHLYFMVFEYFENIYYTVYI